MGRKENPFPTDHRARSRIPLARWLREGRAEAGLTYRELATGTPFSEATLRRAATGTAVPRLPVVEAYASACGASLKTARKLWREARIFETGYRYGLSSAPYPRYISNMGELRAGLRQLYYRAGAMPLLEMERRAGGRGLLPHTTVHRMLQGFTMLNRRQLVAFLEVCDVHERDQGHWMNAWERARSWNLAI
jgi:transcriptional regulator with XRE-family HTH domain